MNCQSKIQFKVGSIFVVLLLISQMISFLLPIKSSFAATDPVANFPDSNLNQAIHDWLGKSVTDAVYKSDIDSKIASEPFNDLTISGNNISDLTGFDIFNGSGLKTLNLSYNSISDLTPIGGVTSLIQLDISENQAVNLIPLSSLTNLTSFSAHNFNATSKDIVDISPLGGLTELVSLDLSDNNISDLSPISNLSNLWNLNLENNLITDVTPLSNLPLHNLYLYGNRQLADSSPLSSLSQLSSLHIGMTGISDLSFLNSLNLIDFEASSLNLDDSYLNTITTQTNLTDLSIYKNNFTTFQPLTVLSSLQTLIISENRLTDISPISLMPNVTTFRFEGNFMNIFSGANKTILDSDSRNFNNNAAFSRPQLKFVAVNQSDDFLSSLNLTAGSSQQITYKNFQTQDGISFTNPSVTISSNLITFSSNDPTVASIDSAGKVTGVKAGTTQVVAKIYNIDYEYTKYKFDVTVTDNGQPTIATGLTITPPTAIINVGDEQVFHAIVSYSDGTSANVTSQSMWATGNFLIAAATGDPAKKGHVTGMSGGTTFVRADWNGLNANANITVVATTPVTLQNITVTPATATIQLGETQQYTATATYSNGSTTDVTNLATWALADTTKATIVASGLATGTAAGNTGVSATWNGMTGNAALTVTTEPVPVTLQGITVTPATATVQVGETQQYTATANYSNGSTTDVTNLATWALADTTKATIVASGLATGTAAGNTGVSATWNGMTGNAALTVTTEPVPVTLQGITVTPATATVQVGETQQYTATANYSDGSTTDVTNLATWALADSTKATIATSGLATGAAAGNTGVSATWNGMAGNAALTVTTAPIPTPTPVPIIVEPVPISEPAPIPEPIPTPTPEQKFGKVYGVVRDITGKPLANIRIEIHSEPQITVTNNRGEYIFDKVELGEHTVILKDAKSLMEIGRIDIKVEEKTLVNATQTNIALTDIIREKKVDFLVIPPSDPQKPLMPKTGDGSVIHNNRNAPDPWLVIFILALSGFLAKWLIRKKA